MGKIKKVCPICKQEFELFLSKKDRIYCSKECYGISQLGRISPKRNKITVRCANCSNLIKIIKSKYKHHKNHFCNNKCRQEWFKKNSKKIIRICKTCNEGFRIVPSRQNSAYYCSKSCYGEANRGENHYKYTGAYLKKPLVISIRKCFKYKAWVIAVLKRDKYMCKCCKKNKGIKLNAHHKKQFSIIIEENNINNLIEALFCEELWDVDNGETLCETCHKSEHKKDKFMTLIQWQ